MAYEITFRDGVLCTAFTGTLNLPNLKQLVEDIARLEADLAVSPHRLGDFSPCVEIDLDFAKMAKIGAIRTQAPLKNPVKSAFVTPKQVHYGFVRMLSMLNDNPNIEIRTFADVDTAWAWLTAS